MLCEWLDFARTEMGNPGLELVRERLPESLCISGTPLLWLRNGDPSVDVVRGCVIVSVSDRHAGCHRQVKRDLQKGHNRIPRQIGRDIGSAPTDQPVRLSKEELRLCDKATELVSALPQSHYETIRCHELARAIGQLLDCSVHDGLHGIVEHSWLWTRTTEPNILDVYCVGRLPMVQLVHAETKTGHFVLGERSGLYRWGKERDDIDEGLVTKLVAIEDPSLC